MINLNCNVNDNHVISMIFNVLYMFDMSVNLFSIKKFLNVCQNSGHVTPRLGALTPVS